MSSMPHLRTDTDAISDEALMRRLQSDGDTAAFDTLYHRFSKRLLVYFFRMLGGDEEKAQDFLQDLFVKVIDRAHLYREGASVSTWLFTIAHNMCKNEYRRLAVRRILERLGDPEAIPGEAVTAGHAMERQDFRADLLRALQRLDAAQRSAFILRYQEQRSIAEISAIMGCSEGTTKSRLFYATRKLADRLAEHHPNAPEAPQHGRR